MLVGTPAVQKAFPNNRWIDLFNSLSAGNEKKIELASSIDVDEVAHNEPRYQYLQSLISVLGILNVI